jgi:hypothetical protein
VAVGKKKPWFRRADALDGAAAFGLARAKKLGRADRRVGPYPR